MSGLSEAWMVLETWLEKATQLLPASIEAMGSPIVILAAAAVLLAALGRHRRSVIEALCLFVLAVVVMRFWYLPALLIAVDSLVRAVRSGWRRGLERQTRLTSQKVNEIASSLDDFLAALDRRAREADGWATAGQGDPPAGMFKRVSPGSPSPPPATTAAPNPLAP
jgi:hypothetical protein